MIDIREFISRISTIYDFYNLGKEGFKHPDIIKKEVDRKIKFLQDFADEPLAKEFFKDGKVPPKEFFTLQSFVDTIAINTKETMEVGINYLRNQTVVLFHSYIEIIMNSITMMILEKETNILKTIYTEKKQLPFKAEEIVDNKDNIINFMIDKEINRFTRFSMQQKKEYFKKYFDIDFARTAKLDFGIDILEIDSLRHDIIHGIREIVLDDHKILLINNYIIGLGLYLLTQSRLKFKIDIVWTDTLGNNYLK